MSFEPYSEYKDSGINWLGPAPSHWSVKRLRHVARLNPGKSELRRLPPETEVTFLPMEAVGDDVSHDRHQTRPLGAVIEGYTYIGERDVAFAKITPCFENGKATLATDLKNKLAFATTELTVLRPDTRAVSARYLYRLVTSRPFRELGEASMYGAGGQKRVPDNFARDFAIPLPPPDEQRQIADFLDHETARIDALIEEQQRLIELLREKRYASISSAVTAGLDPSSPTKDSGIEWIGRIPEHWQVKRIGMLFAASYETGQADLPILSVSLHHGVSDSELSEEEADRKLTRIADREKYKRVRPGDLVYNMMRAWQGAFGAVSVDGLVSPAYVVARPNVSINTEFLEQQLRSPTAIEEMRRFSYGITDFRLRLYWDSFKDIRVALPPEDEQQQIMEKVERIVRETTTLTTEARRNIALLKERRSALISAAVTGKIDVRDWSAQNKTGTGALPKVAEPEQPYG